MGAVITDDEDIMRFIKKFKANGRFCDCGICTRSKGYCQKTDENPDTDNDPRFMHDIIGYNFKAMDFQAAIGLSQLEKFSEIIEKRQKNVSFLNKGLAELETFLQLPLFSEDISYLAYPIIIKNNGKINRKILRQKLQERNIESRPLFGCIPTQQPAYKEYCESYKGKLPNAEYVGENAFYIGCHQYLDESDITYVIESFKEIFKELNLL
jgi:CDP-6-deoxy-D-xylo-4-hexulose-3-dehydrase